MVETAADAVNRHEDLLDRLAGLGMDSADLKDVDGRLTLWCGGDEAGLEKVRAALPLCDWELVGGRAAVVVP